MKFLRGTKIIHIVLTLVVASSFTLIHITRAATAEPGTPEDPVVSQSYVDAKIAALTSEINVLKQQLQNTQPGQPAQGAKYEVVGPLQPGKQIIAGESTEIVVRAGGATAIASDKGGVADLITGTDLGTGANVPVNHLLLIPRNDGRGITITKAETYVLVRGSYSVR